MRVKDAFDLFPATLPQGDSSCSVVSEDGSSTSPTQNTERKKVQVPGREIKRLFVHCAATPNGKAFTAEDIDRWHGERDFNRKSKYKDTFNKELKHIGYHFIIYIDGSLHTGRHIQEIGAHAYMHNRDSLGICLIGTDRFTLAQWITLKAQLAALKGTYCDATIHGHHEVSNKICPGFNVPNWLASGQQIDNEHLYPPITPNIPVPLPRPKPPQP
ncbi:N-acetylmuramoyl-L-alanine amidase [Pseudenhygromyxa sp. WMMC2535]|uniref:N-acetylmuramoyl-L-alanine amidase n=1 Tax=Pseudenhygromyxa sp. WMMC2535 TaxID=2712867 RepID=UPI001551BFE6|nr:N-acetylmuramoyl-L-alanine amidase [Pseudenhygromyxa sp. WMMC2535]NVB39678.1 N-acetylmuramoyl-L-alanine amidase [Pseudenhygromyxa sp. WMMC2535]